MSTEIYFLWRCRCHGDLSTPSSFF